MYGKKSRIHSSFVGIFQDVVGRSTENMSTLNDPLVRVQRILIIRKCTVLYHSQWLTLIIVLRTSTLEETDELVTAQYSDCTLNISMENNTLGMPENSIITGDDAFPLRTNLMKPYSKTGLSNYETILIIGFLAQEEL